MTEFERAQKEYEKNIRNTESIRDVVDGTMDNPINLRKKISIVRKNKWKKKV